MTCQAFNYDDTYCMTFRYYIIDIYEWVEAEDDLLSTMLHNLHKAGQAQEYLLNGYFESTVTWKKGEGVSNEVMRQIYIDMINQMIDDNIITLQMFSEDNQDMLRESLIGNGSQPPQYDLCRIIDIPIVIE